MPDLRQLQTPRTFKIQTSRADNESIETLKIVKDFTEGLIRATGSADRVENPRHDVIEISAGSRLNKSSYLVNIEDHRLDEQLQLDHAHNLNQYLEDTLFTDDIINFIETARLWVAANFSSFKSQSWKISYNQLQSLFKEAAASKRENPTANRSNIVTFAKNEVKEALEELLTVYEKILKPDEVELSLDRPDPILRRIKNEFNTSDSSALQKIWEEVVKPWAKILQESENGASYFQYGKIALSPPDTRSIVDLFYNQIKERLTASETKEPWTNLSQKIVAEFLAAEGKQFVFFSGNNLVAPISIQNDRQVGRNLLDFYDNFFQQLQIKPDEETDEEATEEPEEDAEGGEDEEEEKKEFPKLATEELINNTRRLISDQLWGAVARYFADGALIELSKLTSQEQEQLKINFPAWKKNFLDQRAGALENEINRWLSQQNFTEEGLAALTQPTPEFVSRLTTFLLETYTKDFVALIQETVIQVAEATEDETQPEDRKKPGDETRDQARVAPTETTAPGEKTEAQLKADRRASQVEVRERTLRDLTTQYIGLYFGRELQDDSYLRQLITQQISNKLPPGEIDQNQFFSQLSKNITINQAVFRQASEHYQQQLIQLGFDSGSTLGQVYATLDAAVLVQQNPYEYFENLSDSELFALLGTESGRVNPQDLRRVVNGLIAVTLYYQKYNLSPWQEEIKKSKAQKEASTRDLTAVRSFIMTHGEEGKAALTMNGEQISSLSIDEKRKQKIQDLYRALWVQTVAGLEPEQIVETYLFYGVDPTEIDFRPDNLDVPEGFIYSQMAQFANGNLANASDEQRKKLEGKAMKMALAAMAPEIAAGLEAISKIPIVGDMANDFIDEQLGESVEKIKKNLKIAGTILGLAGAGLIALITKGWRFLIGGGVGATIGGIIGGALAPVLGPWTIPLGMSLGGGIGAYANKAGGMTQIKDWLRDSTGIGGKKALASQVAPAKVGMSASTKAILRNGGIIAGSTTVFITTALQSAFLLDVNPTLFSTSNQAGEESPYVKIIKSATPKKLEVPGKVSYQIQIIPQEDYQIEVTDVLDELNVRYNKDEYPNGTPTSSSDQTIKTLADFEELESGTIIENGDNLILQYDVNYTEEFNHALIANYFTLSFNYSNNSDSGSAEAISISTVKIGNAPEFSGCWPVTGEITQLPFNNYSHQSKTPGYGADAVDIFVPVGTPVYAPFGGIVASTGKRGNYGQTVVISGDDGSFIYAHLSVILVSKNDEIIAGQEIGLSGNTGASSDPHLHYERGNSSGYFYATPLGTPSVLLQLHEAIGLKVGDLVTRENCGG